MNMNNLFAYRCAKLVVMGMLLMCGVSSAVAQRQIQTLNDSWKFLRKEHPAAADSAFNDKGWSDVHLPHTWNTEAYSTSTYYQGVGWYRRTVNLSKEWQGKQIFLRLDAASKAATVYVNGKEVGRHAGGYTACTFDLTDYLDPEAKNVLAIRVDNGRKDIPPISADFTFFGGIYRDAWLIAVPQQHFNLTNLGSDGIFISTPQVSETQGKIAVRGEIKNDASKKTTVEVETRIYAPEGTLLQTKKKIIDLKADETLAFSQEDFLVAKPELWSPENPCLYRVETLLRDKKTKDILDRIEHHTAFRWFSFDAANGFQLNGKPYKLRGMCRHQDQKPIGVALTDEMHRRDFMLMKEMGANFLRISHYPQDDALLEMCDKLGMLVWEEIPIVNTIPTTLGYAETCEINLREMIRQHYNHPSVILWGYMNEIILALDWMKLQNESREDVIDRTVNLAKRLEQVLKEEDDTRLSVMALHESEEYNTTGLSNITDVIGWNMYPGWYHGDFTDFDTFMAKQHKEHPERPVIVSEYGAGSDKRLHSLQPKAFDFSIEYQQKFLEHYLPVLENTPYLCGGAHWNLIDFSVVGRQESMPYINNKGILYSDRTPKDIYYYYQATWRNDIPVLHIASRDWTRRTGIQQGNAPVMLPVKVYSNLPEVELFMNGKSIGKQKVENSTATFSVPFLNKKSFLFAQGVCNGKIIQDGVNIHFTPVPQKLNDSNLKGLELAVNVGSNSFYTSDESHLTWLPDQAYSTGSWGYMGGEELSSKKIIGRTVDVPLFQTVRNNLEGYRFDVPEGVYEIELLFTDIFKEKDKSIYLLGADTQLESRENSFNIYFNGQLLEEGFSPCKESGYFQAIRKKYMVVNEGNCVELKFQAVTGGSFLNGIKLRKLY